LLNDRRDPNQDRAGFLIAILTFHRVQGSPLLPAAQAIILPAIEAW
jgi:hypothetical protein